MEMGQCSTCGGAVSVHARQCPHCGLPFVNPRKRNPGLLILAVILFGVGTCAKFGYDESQKSAGEKRQEIDDWHRQQRQEDVERARDLWNRH